METIHQEDDGSYLSIPGTLILLASLLTLRLLYVVYRTGKPSLPPKKPTNPLRTLIVLGSRGHTVEMINMVNMLSKERFSPRHYVVAATDNMSLQKARVLEGALPDLSASTEAHAQFMQIYRSREVGQSYITSIGTTLVAIAHALWLMIRIRAQVVICNGPGTCVPLCVIAYLFKVVGIRWSSIFYVESIARVRRLSLSGLLLYKLRIADQFYVQWPQLQSKYPCALHVGRLM